MAYVKRGNKPQSAMTANPEKYPQGYFNEKPCKECESMYKPKAPSHLYCSESCADKGNMRNYLRKNYKMTLEEYEFISARADGKCEICGGRGFLMREWHKSYLVIDHCHSTGDVRGLLCHNCNRALGLLQDSVENLKSAIRYLERATTIPEGSTPQAIGGGSAQHSVE